MPATESPSCSKCKEKPARKSDVWCNDCRAAYQKQYRNEREEQIASQSYARGAVAMQRYIAQQFARRPGYHMECSATARWVMEQQPPPYGDKKEPPTEAGGQEQIR